MSLWELAGDQFVRDDAEVAGGVGDGFAQVIARGELAEALAAPGDAADAAVQEAPGPVRVAKAVKVPVAGSTVPHFGEGMTLEALAPDCRRIVELVESGSGCGEGAMAKEIASGLGLELVPAKIEGLRSKARRLAERGRPGPVRGIFDPYGYRP
ncbi:hypothetical protein [Streptomyces sp. NPDC001135]